MAEEKNLEDRVKNLLTSKGYWYVKYWGGGGYTKSGVPDLLCCIGGWFVAVETKASRGRPTMLQIHELRKIQKAGGIAILLYPDDWKSFTKLIDLLTAGQWPSADIMIKKFNERISKWEDRLMKQ